MNNKSSGLFLNIFRNNLFVLGIAWRISKLRFVIKIIVTILSAVLPAANILIIRHIISLLESDAERTDAMLYQIFLVIIGLTAMQTIPKLFTAFNNALIEPILASKINNYMNEVFFEKAREFEYKNFEDPEFYDKYTRALGQAESIPHAVFNSFFQLFGSIIGMLALTALIISMDWIVILFAFFAVLINFIQSLISSRLNFDTSQTLTPISRRQNYIKKVLYNPVYAKEIKCNDVITTGKRHYFKAFKELIFVLKKYGFKIAFINVVVVLLTSISSAIMMMYLFSRVWMGIYTIADFSALTSSSGQLEGTFSSFFSTVTNFYRNSLEIDNLKFVYFYQREDVDGKCHLDNETPYKIEIKNLYFKYPNTNRYALSNISLKIMPGEKVSLVGLNGSGKTTLVKLILGLYKPESGEILINDINLSDYKRDDINKKIGAVFQDHQIFAYSIRENIAFDDEMQGKSMEVLEKLGFSSVVKSLPKGLDTTLSKEFDPDGTLLSGGEAQKICIARALNKTAGLYVFDEPSSALDAMSEYKMNKLLYEVTDKTVIFISHRLTTAVMADKIFLLSAGKLIEQGNHEQLIEAQGLYGELFKMQAENYTTNAK